ncbi:hypothetical protein LOK49_LG09G01830 [Camellia lanceoleosa]|uniref:Uncharacterized protein n=1 Tax=Camellia lanceoleosa TaxID=1840588 RepID=A0ACC0GQ73_9ERIC|nr:hypothetical protein LOK49_LG09G01830 [Camellia lanceoleosa]
MSKRKLVNEAEWLTLKIVDGGQISQLSFPLSQVNDFILKKLKQSQRNILDLGGDLDLKLVNFYTNKSYDVNLKKLEGRDTYTFLLSDEIKFKPGPEIKMRYDNQSLQFYLV